MSSLELEFSYEEMGEIHWAIENSIKEYFKWIDSAEIDNNCETEKGIIAVAISTLRKVSL